jgi:hypothetical protein
MIFISYNDIMVENSKCGSLESMRQKLINYLGFH